MDTTILDWFVTLSFFSYFIPLTIILINFKQQESSFRILAAVLALSIVADFFASLLISFHLNPNYSSNIYWLIAPALSSSFFYKILDSKKIRLPLGLFNLSFFVFGFINLIFIQKISINSYTQIIYALLIILLCIIFFFRLIKELPAAHVAKIPFFWIVSGFFFSFSGKIVIYTLTHYLIHFINDNLIIVWSFHNFLTIIANLFIAWGVWINHKQRRSTSLSQWPL